MSLQSFIKKGILALSICSGSGFGKTHLEASISNFKRPDESYTSNANIHISHRSHIGNKHLSLNLEIPSSLHRTNSLTNFFPAPPRNPRYLVKYFDFNWQGIDFWHFGVAKNSDVVATLPFNMTSVQPKFSINPMEIWTVYQAIYVASLKLKTHIGPGEGQKEFSDNLFLHQSFSLKAASGIFFELHASQNNNNKKSIPLSWLTEESPKAGFKTKRYSASVYSDGSHPKARGLLAGTAYYITEQKDQNESVDLLILPSRLSNLDYYTLESEGQKSKITFKTHRYFLSYRILDKFVISYLYERQFIVNSVPAGFVRCSQIELGVCQNPEEIDSLSRTQQTWTFGGHYDERFYFAVDWEYSRFNHLFENHNFQQEEDKKSQRMTTIVTRIHFIL